MEQFQLKTEYIELIKLLKVMQVAATGGHAKILVEEGDVIVNGEVENRKRMKVRAGDVVEVEGVQIEVVD